MCIIQCTGTYYNWARFFFYHLYKCNSKYCKYSRKFRNHLNSHNLVSHSRCVNSMPHDAVTACHLGNGKCILREHRGYHVIVSIISPVLSTLNVDQLISLHLNILSQIVPLSIYLCHSISPSLRLVSTLERLLPDWIGHLVYQGHLKSGVCSTKIILNWVLFCQGHLKFGVCSIKVTLTWVSVPPRSS